MSAEAFPYRVQIISNIESSYRKGVDGLPELIKRKPDGTMEVHSAADWDKLQKAWFGGGIYTANQMGYLSPKYQWTWSGGTPKALAASDLEQDRPQIKMDSGSKLPSVTSGDVNLSGEIDGKGLTKTSTATVDVSEKAVDMPTDLESDTYTVNWHLPYESQGSLPSLKMKLSGTSYTVPRYGSITIQEEAPQTIDVGAGFEGLAGALGALAGVPGGPAGVIAGGGVAASLAQGLSGTFDLTWTINGTPEYTWTNGADDWTKIKLDQPGNVDYPAWLTDPNGFANFDVTMVRMTRWTRMRWVCDEYGGNGSIGPDRVLAKDLEPKAQFEPFYTLIEGRDVAPPSPRVTP